MAGKGNGEQEQEHGEERARWIVVSHCPSSRAAAVAGGCFGRSSVAFLLCGAVRVKTGGRGQRWRDVGLGLQSRPPKQTIETKLLSFLSDRYVSSIKV